jgi:DNA (cytosine-5)-methyltransferase 1
VSRPRLLDLFCGAGGAAVGYWRAGFAVTGVDLVAQPRYPFEFVQAEALAWLAARTALVGRRFAAIHASPPCQVYSELRTMRNRLGGVGAHPDLIAPLRELLDETGLPYVIENVPGAPLRDPVAICGTAVGLPVVHCLERHPHVYRDRQVYRHRLFETNWPLAAPPCDHSVPALGTYGNGGRWKRNGRRGGYQGTPAENRKGMGIGWMTREELADAIPPAYTELIGRELLASLAVAA